MATLHERLLDEASSLDSFGSYKTWIWLSSSLSVSSSRILLLVRLTPGVFRWDIDALDGLLGLDVVCLLGL
jgi:hypothetical protein